MSWEDRLKEAIYTSPGGTEFQFTYENVSEENVKNTVAYTFPDADGSFVQDLGKQGRKYPLRCIFHGENYDIEALSFVNGLLEKGIGQLQHPIYGSIDVVPFGAITRRDDLKSGAGVAFIDVVFFETNNLLFPTSQDDPESDVLDAIEDYNKAARFVYNETTSLKTTSEQAVARPNFKKKLEQSRATIRQIAEKTPSVLNTFDGIYDSIINSLDTLLGDPLTLASQTLLMLEKPADSVSSIKDKLDSYEFVLSQILNQANALLGLDSENSNNFHADDLFASTYVVGSVKSAVNTTFEIKTDALNAADIILTQMDELTVWRDDNYASLEEIDTGESYDELFNAVSILAGFLVEISFTLKQEKVFFLDRSRNFIELTFELYGDVDDETLNFFINTNNLTGSQIIELPIGQKIVYYV